MREVVILGVGMHPFGRFPGVGYVDMARVAIVNALADASLSWKDIQAVYAGHSYAPTGAGSNVVAELGMTGMPIVNVEAGCSSGQVGLHLAYQAIAGGHVDIACAVGFEKMPKAILPADSYPEWVRLMGLAAFPQEHGWQATRWIKEYGLTVEQLAKVSVRAHKNASACPYAHYGHQGDITVEEVLSAEMICDPITKLQICPVSEGAAAAILCAKKVAYKYKRTKPVLIGASVVKSDMYEHPYSFLAQGTPSLACRTACKEAYEMSGCGPRDLDVIQCHDTYTIVEIAHWPEIGICTEDQCARLIDEGETEITGKFPINTDGGMLARGNAIGGVSLASVAEITWQLRGKAERRQVPNAKVGLAYMEGIGPIHAATIMKI
jgi:acetyl-CoA acetyltransferase